MSFTKEEGLEFFEENLDRNINHAARQLLSKSQLIQDKLKVLDTKINKKDYQLINDLGELQGLGDQLDRLCGELGALMMTKKDFVSLVKEDHNQEV